MRPFLTGWRAARKGGAFFVFGKPHVCHGTFQIQNVRKDLQILHLMC